MPKKTSTSTTSKKTAPRLVANKTATASSAAAITAVTDTQIAERAFCIYMDEGCPEGRHLDHWFQAKAELSV